MLEIIAPVAAASECCFSMVGSNPASAALLMQAGLHPEPAMTNVQQQPQQQPFQQQQQQQAHVPSTLHLKQQLSALHLGVDQAVTASAEASPLALQSPSPLQLQQQQQPPGAAIPVSPRVAPITGSGRARRRSSRCEHARRQAGTASGYSTDSYWNSRYAEKCTHFDWFFNYSALAALINGVCNKDAGACLHVGCGNSSLSDGLAEDGFQVVNVDISPVVIEQMRQMEQLPGQSWEVADCRNMPQFADGLFGSVLDKGTLDAVLCSSHGAADAAAYVDEVYRVLAPGGVFLLISLGQPQARMSVLRAGPPGAATQPRVLPYLSQLLQQRMAAEETAAAVAAAGGAAAVAAAAPLVWAWESVEVFLLPKPTLYMQSESSLTGKPIASSMHHADKDMPVHWLGPFKPGPELEAATAQDSLDLREFFTAFACTKPRGAAVTAAGGSSGGAAAPAGPI